jgi:hypothetical protein
MRLVSVEFQEVELQFNSSEFITEFLLLTSFISLG